MNAEIVTRRLRSRNLNITRSAAGLLVAVLVCVGCTGSDGQTATRPTLGSAEPTPEDLVFALAPNSDSQEAVDGDDANPTAQDLAAQEPIGPPLPPRSSAEQILEVVSDIHGPTYDMAAQMNRLVRFPEIPTPPGAELVELRADVRERETAASLTISSEIGLHAAGTVEELVEFYENAFSELEYTVASRSSRGSGSARTEHLGYRIPDTTYEQSDVEVSVTARGEEAPDSVQIRIRFVEVADVEGDGSPRRRFEGWVGDLPLPEGGEVIGAAIQTSNLTRHSLHFSLAVRYDGQTAISLAEQFRQGLPADGYSIVPKPSMGETLDNWVYLEHPFFADVRVSPHRIGSPEDPLVTTVNIDARVDFSPRS